MNEKPKTRTVAVEQSSAALQAIKMSQMASEELASAARLSKAMASGEWAAQAVRMSQMASGELASAARLSKAMASGEWAAQAVRMSQMASGELASAARLVASVFSSSFASADFKPLASAGGDLANWAAERLSGTQDEVQADVDERFIEIVTALADAELDEEFERRIAEIPDDAPELQAAEGYWNLATLPKGRERKILLVVLGGFTTALLYFFGMLAAPEETTLVRDTIGIAYGSGAVIHSAVKWSEKARSQLDAMGPTPDE